MELQHFSHEHPLVFYDEGSHESRKVYCSGCGELVSGPCFGCAECGYYLDKKCAEAPSEMNHPFHRNHSLKLLVSNRYPGSATVCDLCDKTCQKFVYHCSCNLDLHIKCAFFSKDIAGKRFGVLEDISHKDPLTSPENRFVVKEAVCFVCYKPLSNAACIYLDSEFRLHKKCADLPTEINHFSHTHYPFILQFNSEHLPCQICQKTQDRGLVYCCSHCDIALHVACVDLPTKIEHLSHTKHPLILQIVSEPLTCQICQETNKKYAGFVYYCSICKFGLHIECASSPPAIIETKSHQHPFTLFRRHVSFICDACGTPGRYVSYICSTCGLIVHEKCTSIPRTLKHPMHIEHPISHTYFLGEYKLESLECRICHLGDVNSEHGGYYCSDCNYIAHVNCAIEDYNWYKFDEFGDERLGENSPLPPYSIILETKDGDNVLATEIKHFTHMHNLVLSIDIKDDKCCDGCVLSITTSYYYCSQCDFCLHKSCAEFPRKKYFWFDPYQKLHSLTSNCIFQCSRCLYESSGFAYTCDESMSSYCLRCASVSDSPVCGGHEHPVPLLHKYNNEVFCNACGDSLSRPNGCKRCNFYLHEKCMKLPLVAQHKYDEHPFKLTHHDDNSYLASHYCDICEEKRNPKYWFYHCAICDNSAHPKCVLGKYPFIKLGSMCRKGDHPHPLTFVQKVELYPECHICGEPCFDLTLECKTIECNYFVHWECIKLGSL